MISESHVADAVRDGKVRDDVMAMFLFIQKRHAVTA